MRRTRALVWLLIVLDAGLLACATAVRCLRPSADAAPPPWADEYDLTAQPPEVIAPGTLVDRGPPVGWSHLVIKSLPRVRPDEAVNIPWNPLCDRAEVVRRATWMFTAFAADVVRERHGAHERHRLRAVGLGLGAKVDGRDTVLTPEWAGIKGTKLDWIERDILAKGYAVQKQVWVAVHGPSFALVDTPVAFRCGERNRMVRFRYALLVDPPTGGLAAFCWRTGAEGGECADLTRAVLLNPDAIDEAELVVDRKAFTPGVGIPGELAFGVDALPPHRLEVALPAELSPLAARTRYAPAEAAALEAALRQLLPGP